jgi:hypothetical protein
VLWCCRLGHGIAGNQSILSYSSPKSAMSLRVPPSAVMKRFRTSCVNVAALDLGEPCDGDAHPGGYLVLGQPRRLRISASRQPRSSSSIAVSNASPRITIASCQIRPG